MNLLALLSLTVFCSHSNPPPPVGLPAGDGADATSSIPAAMGPTFRFADFDGDGFADLFAVRPAHEDRLFKNLRDGTFLDVTEAAGLAGLSGSRLALWSDFDGDGEVDLYVSAANGKSHLFKNKAGSFIDVTDLAGVSHRDGAELYAEWIDYDNDLQPDLHLVTSRGDRVFHNQGRARFEQAELPELSDLDQPVIALQPQAAAQQMATSAPVAEMGAADGVDVADADSGESARHARRSRPFDVGLPLTNAGSGGAAINGAGGSGTYSASACPPKVQDAANGNCLSVSSTPTLGALYPLSTNLNVSAAGRVGIGTTTPASKLSVVDTAPVVTNVSSNNTGGTSTRIANTSAGGQEWSIASTGASSSEGVGKLVVRDISSGTLAMAVSPNGNVGIGTTASTVPLAVAGAVYVDYASANTGTDANALHFGDNSSGEAIGCKRSGVGTGNFGLDFYTNHLLRMSIAQSGLMGLGTTAPEARLHVLDGSAGSVIADSNSVLVLEDSGPSYMSILTPNANERGLLFGQPSNNAAGGIMYNNAFTPDGLQLRTNGNVTRMAIDGAGRVGIGTTAPGEQLEVFGADATLRLRNTNDSIGGFAGNTFSALQLGMYNPTGTAQGSIPPNTKRSLFGFDRDGKVGSLTNNFGAPSFRNLLDDGTGRGSFAAKTKFANAGSDDCAVTADVNAGSLLIVDGVRAFTNGQDSWGVWGRNTFTGTGSVQPNGVVGENSTPTSFGVFSIGNFGCSGLKLFIQPHPVDASKEVRYVCLEGNEAGTYFRGSGHIVGGRAVIEVPEDFRLVSDSEGLTVQLTPIGSLARMAIASKGLDRIVVIADQDAEFDYVVNGVRRGFTEHEPIQSNSSFVPAVRGVPFGTQYPDALRRILVDNGTLNADFTPNEVTAARMGWKLVDADSPDARFARPTRADTNQAAPQSGGQR